MACFSEADHVGVADNPVFHAVRCRISHLDTKDLRIPLSSVVGLSDDELCWVVVDPIWPAAETEDELAILDQGTKGQQAIYVTMLYAQEVDNGGLAQFFGNSSGMLWQQVRSGLQLLGAQEQMALITAAIEAFPQGAPSAEQSERKHALRQLTQEQRDLWRAGEGRVYALGGFFADLRPVWTQYIQTHPEDFFFPSDT
jgi:Domain of unknown function (DUF4375)